MRFSGFDSILWCIVSWIQGFWDVLLASALLWRESFVCSVKQSLCSGRLGKQLQEFVNDVSGGDAWMGIGCMRCRTGEGSDDRD